MVYILKDITVHMFRLISTGETVDLFLDTCRDIMAESDNCLRNSCLLLIVGAIAGYISRGELFIGDGSQFNLIFSHS